VEDHREDYSAQLTPLYSIGSVARMLSVSVQTLRHYEREGLIVPYKSESNQRWYSRADIERLECIRKAINVEKLSIEGIKHVHALIPCWQIKGCSEQDRAGCDAFKGHARGCWSYNHENNACSSRDCRLCEVYRMAVNCEEIKKSIIQWTNNAADLIEH
jgi:MerR family transcriptional regulator/heat shock protein HspR